MDMKKVRLDLLLVERGLAESRSLAQRLVMAGQVRVNGEVVLRVGSQRAAGCAAWKWSRAALCLAGRREARGGLASFRRGRRVGGFAPMWALPPGVSPIACCSMVPGRVYAIDVGPGDPGLEAAPGWACGGDGRNQCPLR